MSIYGALYSGVSGLKAQGTNMGVISDNISNVNTIGYKASEAVFETLVNNSPNSVSYNPGGVLADSRMFVDKQGLLQATDNPTDIAVSGNGFFVVNRLADASSDYLYTRAGSFRPDALGDFRNTAGFYLMAWPLDRDGRLPGQAGNLDTTAFSTLQSLKVVNVESTNGVAAATTSLEVGANLDGRQTVYPGAGSSMAVRNIGNRSISALDVIVPVTTASPVGINTSGLALGDVLTLTSDLGEVFDFEYGGIHQGVAIPGVSNPAIMFGVTNQTQTFFTTPTAPGVVDSVFTITTPSKGTFSFTYRQGNPNPLQGEFNSMDTLANAINQTKGLSARIVSGQLYVSSENGNDSLTVANNGVTDWADQIFGVTSGTAGNLVTAAGPTPRFSNLQDLATKVTSTGKLTAVVSSPLADTGLRIRTNNPLGTLSFTDNNANGENAAWRELGFVTNLDIADPLYVNGFGPSYDPTTATQSMAGGGTTPQFSRNIRIYDALGQGHSMIMGFVRIDQGLGRNIWAVELYAAEDGDINTLNGFDQVSYGTVEFNGDGTLRAVTGALQLPVNINWTNGASPSTINLDFGTFGDPVGTVGATQIGKADGLSQFSSDFNWAFDLQNGAEVGALVGVSIDERGFVIANYSNGESLKLYKIPLADFANPNGLAAKTGNIFSETQAAGPVNLRDAGTSGMGDVVSGVLESSNAELAEELTDMIVAQRAYQANAKVITTADSLLEELNRI